MPNSRFSDEAPNPRFLPAEKMWGKVITIVDSFEINEGTNMFSYSQRMEQTVICRLAEPPLIKQYKNKVALVLSRLFLSFMIIVFASLYVMTDFAAADTAEKFTQEVKQGVKDAKEEIKKMPEEFKKAGKELKGTSEKVKKGVETELDEGKKNLQDIKK